MILSRRWDSLGARLSGIAGAAGLARLLDCEFAFEWPTRDSTITYPAADLFSAEFCDRHLVAAGVADPADVMQASQMGHMTLAEVRQRISDRRPAFILFDDPYVRPVSSDDTPTSAVQRFKTAAAGIGLSERAGSIRSAVEQGVEGIGLALHARYGDLVTGQWRRFVPREKFRPRALLERAIERAGSAGTTVLVVSDSQEFVDDLVQRRDDVVTLLELVPGYDDLDEIERSWADVFALAAIGRVLAPSSSAFSGFAAAAAGQRPVDVLDEVPREERVPLLLGGVRREVQGSTAFVQGIASREICYLLDSDTGELEASDRLHLAREAHSRDPDHPEAATRVALCATALGRFEEAADGARRAMVLGDAARDVHDDPGVDSLAGAVVVAAVGRVCRRRVALPSIGSLVDEIRSLRPYQQPHADLVRACEHLARSAALLGTSSRRAARRARRSLDAIGPGSAGLALGPVVWKDLEYSAILAAVERASFWVAGHIPMPRAARPLDAEFRLGAMSANGVPWVECEIDSPVEPGGVLVIRDERCMIAPRAWRDGAPPRTYWMPFGAGVTPDSNGAAALRDLEAIAIGGAQPGS